MPLQPRGFLALPPHARAGGFDHAAVHEPTGRIFVAHTANDAVDVIDIETQRWIDSLPGLSGVAGALVAGALQLVLTSNRGENTVGVFSPTGPPGVERIGVGIRPNGLAYDSRRGRLLVAHVGDPAIQNSCTVSIIDIATRQQLAVVPVPGRTRWTVYDPAADVFHVNIADPPAILVVEARDPIRVRRSVPILHRGPHGLDLDLERRRLFCACDGGVVLEVDADRGAILETEPLVGTPDVVFFNPTRHRLYVAIGDPGVIEVFETTPLRRRGMVATEIGAHTRSRSTRRVSSSAPSFQRATAPPSSRIPSKRHAPSIAEWQENGAAS